jgi:hypothetical protein
MHGRRECPGWTTSDQAFVGQTKTKNTDHIYTWEMRISLRMTSDHVYMWEKLQKVPQKHGR